MSTLQDIIEPLEGARLVGGGTEVEVVSLAHDTRRVEPGSCFFCIPGSTRDGHDLAGEAVAAGAAALVVERELPELAVPQVVVPSVRAAMGPMADLHSGRPSARLQVLGITGTNGKTTSSYLLRAMLEAAGRQTGLIGTTGLLVGGEHGLTGFTTPEADDLQAAFAGMLEAGDQAAAIEVSSHALDQGRVTGTRFAAVGFTNLTRDHLDYHRSFEAYYHAKRRLFVEPGPEGRHHPAAINCDDEWGSRLFDELVHAERDEVPVWGWTLRDMARASVSGRFQLVPEGADIIVETPVGEFALRSKLRGRFNVENVLTATTMALLVGVEPEHIQAGLAGVHGVPGRFEPVDEGQPFTVLVDYAHTPDSLEQVLASARAICDGRLIVVFGCGGDRDRSKRPRMGRAAALQADVAIITSDNPRSEDPAAIASEIRRGMRRARAEVVEELDRRAAIHAAIGQAAPGDVVVVAGKGHEQGQEFADQVVPFDDAQVVREALGSVATAT